MNFEDPRDANEPSPEERWLDDALTHYSTAEPRPGLENRILANLEAHDANRQRRWFYGFAAVAAVLLFAVAVTTVRTRKEDNSGDLAKTKSRQGQTSFTTAENKTGSQPRRSARVVRRQSLGRHNNVADRNPVLQANVKQEHFPADRPLSEQDRLLLSYLNQTSPQEMEHVVAAQQEVAAARQRWEDETNSQERP